MIRALALSVALATSLAAQELTLASFAEEVGSVRAVALKPTNTFTARQFSSYDRRSVSRANGGDDGWFANGDQGQFLRSEVRDGKTEWVMADVDGPGVVTRIWSADPKGVMRVYIDGADAPAIEDEMKTLLGGSHRLAPAPLAGARSMGWNWHVPIPYAKHLKVTVSEKTLYYHVNVRTYAAGTAIRSYSAAEVAAAAPALTAAARILANPGPPEFNAGEPGVLTWNAELPPQGAAAFEPPHGDKPMALTALAVRFTGDAPPPAAWRSVIIRARFDGEACIEAPLGDFFGTGPGLRTFASAPTGMAPGNSGWSRWVMPWAKGASFEFANLSGAKLSIALDARVETLPEGTAIRHFHANWRQDRDLPTRPRTDWNALTAEGGAGVYVGCAMFVANPVKEWWGEGDEKFIVDGEAFPSTFGTGSEDFFGYAWCCNKPFVHALHGQPRCDGPANYGFTSVYRWQFSDCVPWTRSFTFDIEVWHWADCKVSQSMTVFWYGDPGVRAKHPPITTAAQIELPVLPELKLKKVEGAIEGESMTVVSKSGTAERQDLDETVWSGGAHLWWRGAKPGDKLVLEFAAPSAGKYDLRAAFTKARDYGIHRISINGTPVGEPRDFYDRSVVVTPEVDLGVISLVAGANRIEVECTGKREKAVPGYMFGLDYLVLKKAE